MLSIMSHMIVDVSHLPAPTQGLAHRSPSHLALDALLSREVAHVLRLHQPQLLLAVLVLLSQRSLVQHINKFLRVAVADPSRS